jgi:membrane protein
MEWIRRLAAVLVSSAKRYAGGGLTARAAGIAYRVLFSLAPLAIVLVSVFGLVLQNDELKQDVVDRIVSVLPVDASGHARVEHEISNIASPASAAGLISPRAPDDKRPLVRAKLVDLTLVGGATILVLLSVGVGLVSQFVRALVSEVGIDGSFATKAVSTGLVLVLWVATALLLYRFVPAAKLRFTDALAGAIVTAVLLLGISLAGSLLYAKTTQWSLIYGSLTSVLVFLYSVYLCANVLLFGGVVASEWSQTRSSPT